MKQKTKKPKYAWDDKQKIYRIPLNNKEKKLQSFDLYLPNKYLSPSAITTYLRCALQFYYRYILGKVSPPNVNLIEGGCHHKTLEYNNEYKHKRDKDLTTKKVIEHFCDGFVSKRSEIEDWCGENEGRVLTRGKLMQANYLNCFAPSLKPKMIEKKIQITLGKIPLLFISDVIGRYDNKPVLIDYKTKAKLMSFGDIEGSVQLGINKLGINAITGGKTMGAGFCVLKKNGGCETVWQPLIRDKQLIEWTRILVIRVAKSISMGSFPPCDPSAWNCSPKWCGYWRICRGAK